MPTTTALSGVVADYVAAVNAFDLDRIMATSRPTPTSTTTGARYVVQGYPRLHGQGVRW